MTALRKPFEDSWEVVVGQARTRHLLRNCNDYLALGTDQIETKSPGELRNFLGDASTCQALKLLRGARPSKRSFLDGFQVDANATRVLPAAFYLDLSPDEEAALSEAVRAGRTWKSFDPKVHADRAFNAGSPPHFIGKGYDAYVSEYARGDFDHDGTEDLLVAREASPSGGSMTDYTVFLLTRISEGAPLTILKTWRQGY